MEEGEGRAFAAAISFCLSQCHTYRFQSGAPPSVAKYFPSLLNAQCTNSLQPAMSCVVTTRRLRPLATSKKDTTGTLGLSSPLPRPPALPEAPNVGCLAFSATASVRPEGWSASAETPPVSGEARMSRCCFVSLLKTATAWPAGYTTTFSST